MQEGVLRSLEFDRIVEAVQSFVLTPLGEAQLAHLRPFTDPRKAQASLAATSEYVRYMSANAPLTLDAPPDLDQTLVNLAIAQQPLEAQQLIGLASFLSSVGTVRTSVATAKAGPYSLLSEILDCCASFDKEIAEIRSKVDPEGYVVDNASPELRTIRERLKKQRNRLRNTLDSYLRGKETSRYLQEQIVTERSGRYVLVVRSEHRSAIPGIVHGNSGSRASLFLEPLSTVEINNDIIALEKNEADETHRILLALANALRKRAFDLRQTLTAATEIDVIQARAAFAQLIDGVEPTLVADNRIEFYQARHPLLIPAVRARLSMKDSLVEDQQNNTPVPVDLCLIPPTSVLIVTGPNTGGKTVALKTVGLLSIMAQAGLHVSAAAGSKVTVFRSIFADIGDEQSITTNLSTFSGHIANVVAMDRHLALPALVLLDEIGSGTDPVDGGALGAAILDHFRKRRALVVSTTHDDMLKSYASTTSGVECAGFGFNPETFEPNYQLAYGAPGRSLALEIAARLGVSSTIIDAARKRRSTRENQLAEHLTKVDDELRVIDEERQRMAVEKKRVAADNEKLVAEQRKLQEQENTIRKNFTKGVDDRIRGAHVEIDSIVDKLRARALKLEQTVKTRATSGKPTLTTGEVGTLRTETRDELSKVADRTVAAKGRPSTESSVIDHEPTQPVARPRVGNYVTVGTLGLDGRVIAVHKAEVEVEVRGKRLHVPADDLRVIDNGQPPTQVDGLVTVQVDELSDPMQDLNVIGCDIDEALSRTEKYLDQALVQEQRRIRIIHGHGTGQLRRAITSFLSDNSQVARFEFAKPDQGGSGVTIIELKE